MKINQFQEPAQIGLRVRTQVQAGCICVPIGGQEWWSDPKDKVYYCFDDNGARKFSSPDKVLAQQWLDKNSCGQILT